MNVLNLTKAIFEPLLFSVLCYVSLFNEEELSRINPQLFVCLEPVNSCDTLEEKQDIWVASIKKEEVMMAWQVLEGYNNSNSYVNISITEMNCTGKCWDIYDMFGNINSIQRSTCCNGQGDIDVLMSRSPVYLLQKGK